MLKDRGMRVGGEERRGRQQTVETMEEGANAHGEALHAFAVCTYHRVMSCNGYMGSCTYKTLLCNALVFKLEHCRTRARKERECTGRKSGNVKDIVIASSPHIAPPVIIPKP